MQHYLKKEKNVGLPFPIKLKKLNSGSIWEVFCPKNPKTTIMLKYDLPNFQFSCCCNLCKKTEKILCMNLL